MTLNFMGLRTAVVGIGNELNGDDAAGVLAARALKKEISDMNACGTTQGGSKTAFGSTAEVLVIDAGPAPENFSGPLRRLRPEVVIFIDAADLALPPGSFTWVDWRDVEGFSGSTHLLPLSVFSNFLIQELHCRVAFVGIQPACINFGTDVSQPVLRSVHEITRELFAMIFV